VCKHDKFGFCKFGDQCRKEHIKEICRDLNACKTIKTCHKRHPKVCRRFTIDKLCRFGSNCAYFHLDESDTTSQKSISDMNEKLINLENTVVEMGQLIRSLQTEIQDMKITKTKTNAKLLETPTINVTPLDPKLVEITQNSEIKDDSEKTESRKEELFKCDKCDYRCKRKVTMEKHKNIKHDKKGEECKNCKEVFTTKIVLLKHVAEKHSVVKDKKEDSESDMDSDIDSEFDGDMMECVDCPDQFPNSFALLRHIKKHHC
jgi:hypothetical protein